MPVNMNLVRLKNQLDQVTGGSPSPGRSVT